MPEKDLIIKCQKGDARAFEQLLEMHYETIYRFAFHWCGHQHNAQDITQLACIKLARSIRLFKHQSSFTSWLYRLVINCAKDFYKSPNKVESGERIEQKSELQINESLFAIEDGNPQRLYAQQLLQHIDELQPELKDTLILVFGRGLSHAQTAEYLHVKESTVSWRIHQARKHLKRKFTTSNLTHNQLDTSEVQYERS